MLDVQQTVRICTKTKGNPAALNQLREQKSNKFSGRGADVLGDARGPGQELAINPDPENISHATIVPQPGKDASARLL